MTDEQQVGTDSSEDPRHDAARLALVVVGEAAALHAGDDESLDASQQNIRETVDDMVDEPLTDRQEEVVERLASAGGTIAAGLGGALAAETGRRPEEVLEGAARSFVWQERFADATHDRSDATRDRSDPTHDRSDADVRRDGDGPGTGER